MRRNYFFLKCSRRIKGLFPSIHFRFILPLKLCWTNCLREPRLPSCRDHFSFNLLSTNLAFVFPSTMAIRFVTINVDEKKHLSEEFTVYRGNEPRGLLDEDEKSAWITSMFCQLFKWNLFSYQYAQWSYVFSFLFQGIAQGFQMRYAGKWILDKLQEHSRFYINLIIFYRLG